MERIVLGNVRIDTRMVRIVFRIFGKVNRIVRKIPRIVMIGTRLIMIVTSHKIDGQGSIQDSLRVTRGRRHYRKAEKFGTNSQLGLPPHPSDNSDIFEFQNFLRNSTPPLRIKFRTF